jgi:alkylation response protein AidB-like acyl-CoA dehydrogenase
MSGAVDGAADRRRRMRELADRLAADFATRAAQHDREGDFPFENYRAMADAGYLGLTTPAELGGWGANLEELCLAQERLARGCQATALAVNMHLFAMGLQAQEWRQQPTPKTDALLRASAQGEVILAGTMSEAETGSYIIFATTRATPVDGGFRVNGRKIFCSLGPAMTHFRSSAVFDDPSRGPTLIHFIVPAGTPGLELQNDWDAMGMRATGSHSIKLNDVYVPTEAVSAYRPPGVYDRFMIDFLAWFELSLASVYLGLAAAALELTIDFNAKRVRFPSSRPAAHHPGVQLAVGQMTLDLAAARALLYETVRAWDADPTWTGQQAVARICAAKHLATANAVRIVDRALDAVGGAGYFKRLPLERMYRDVRAGPIHTFNPDDAFEILGKTALGIPLDADPRWG